MRRYSLKIDPRTARFISIMAINFSKLLAILAISLTIGGVIGYVIAQLVVMYGSKIVIASIAVIWLLGILGTIAGAMSEDQLSKMEREEEKTMQKLKMARRA